MSRASYCWIYWSWRRWGFRSVYLVPNWTLWIGPFVMARYTKWNSLVGRLHRLFHRGPNIDQWFAARGKRWRDVPPLIMPENPRPWTEEQMITDTTAYVSKRPERPQLEWIEK